MSGGMNRLLQRCLDKKTMICLVGAGGKTSCMTWLARACAKAGKKVLVTTSTHIMMPEQYYGDQMDEVEALWAAGHFAIIGTDTNHYKLSAPPEGLFQEAAALADVVLVEADGANRLPCKIPAAHEPVILDDCDLVIGVMGMTAIGKPMKDVCFRFDAVGDWLNASEDDVLSEELAARILSDPRGTRKFTEGKEYIAILNQCDDELLLSHGMAIAEDLQQKHGIDAICVSLKKCLQEE